MANGNDQGGSGSGVDPRTVRSTSTALDDLTAAARRADEVFGNDLVFNVRTTSDALKTLGVGGQRLARVFEVFESRFQTLNRMSQYGANFDFNIRQLDQTAINARLNFSQLTSILKNNSQAVRMFGMDTNAGLVQFTQILRDVQNAQVKYGQSIELNARLLGYSFDELNDTVLEYNQIVGFARSRERFDETQRNQSTQRYIETVDELTRLTGKRRDQVSDEMVNQARQGQNIVRARQLGERGDDYMQFLGRMETMFGQNIGRLSSDLLGPGYGQTRDMQILQGQYGDLSTALFQLRQAYEDPSATDEEIRRLEDYVAQQAAATGELAVNSMAIHNRSTEVGGVLADTVTQQAQMAAQIDRYRDALNAEGGRQYTTQEAFQHMLDQIRLNQERGQAPAAEGTPLAFYQNFIKQQIDNERASNQARQNAVDLAYDNFATTINRVNTALGTFRTNIVNNVADLTRFFNDNLSNTFDVTDIVLGNRAQGAYEAALQASRNASDEEQARLAADLATQIQEKTTQLRNSTNSADTMRLTAELNDLIARANALRSNQIIIDAMNGSVVIDADDVQVIERVPGAQNNALPNGDNQQAMGTFGRTGAFFQNFGVGRAVRLDGVEGVFRPRHIETIMALSSQGTARAFADAVTNRGFQDTSTILASVDGSFRMNTAKVDSMLNTVRTTLRETRDRIESSVSTTDTDAVISEFMNRLPTEIRIAMETAMGNSLKPQLEQLVNISTKQAETSGYIRRNTAGISGDLLRQV